MWIALILLEVIMAAIAGYPAIGPAPAQNRPSSKQALEPAEGKLSHPEVPRIAALEVKQWIAQKADIIIIDTQPAENYQMWHIPTAVNIPYVSTANPMDRELMLRALPLDKTIVIYCLCEEGTDSARMALELNRLGYDPDRVKVLEGGLIKWDEKGYPMIKTEVFE